MISVLLNTPTSSENGQQVIYKLCFIFLVGQSPVNGVTELSAWYMCVKVNTPIIPNMVSLESLAYV